MKRLLSGLFCCVLLTAAAKPHFGEMIPICAVSFTAKTQVGEMSCRVAVCHLESELGVGSSLYVVKAYEREYPPKVERMLEGAHSPIIELRGDRIVVLFTGGVNTTWVAEFSIEKGRLEFLSEEKIAWNDSGIYRTSAAFARYSDLLRRRNEPNKAPEPTPGPVTPHASSGELK